MLLGEVEQLVGSGDDWTDRTERRLRALVFRAIESVAHAEPGFGCARVLLWISLHGDRPATHAEIAVDCFLSRETVTRSLGKLDQAGEISRSGKRYRLTS